MNGDAFGPKKGIVIKSESNPVLLVKNDELVATDTEPKGYLLPASMTRTEVCLLSANRAAITLPAVPAVC